MLVKSQLQVLSSARPSGLMRALLVLYSRLILIFVFRSRKSKWQQAAAGSRELKPKVKQIHEWPRIFKLSEQASRDTYPQQSHTS